MSDLICCCFSGGVGGGFRSYTPPVGRKVIDDVRSDCLVASVVEWEEAQILHTPPGEVGCKVIIKWCQS